MKSLTIVIATLVVTLIFNGPIQSYADPQFDTLVNIATQARNNLNISISQISNVPDEIARLYKQGSDETDALIKAANAQDIVSAKQHFLSAMNFFKTTNDKINSLNATETNDQQHADITKLQSEITRLKKIAETLRTIAIINHANFDFTPFDTSIQQAKQALDAGHIDEASKSINVANQLLISAHHTLSEIAQKRTSDRAKDFTEKQIERFNKIKDHNATQNTMVIVSNNTTSTTNSNLTSIEHQREMVTKLRKLVAEGNVDEALKILKSLDMYKKEQLKNNEHAVQPQTNVNIQNNTNSGSNPSPTNPSNNNTSNQIDKDKRTNKIEHQVIIPQININIQNNTNSGSNPSPTNSSNPVSANPVRTNSSNSDISNQIGDDKKSDKTAYQVIPQGNADSQQQDKTHEKQNHEKIREKLKREKQNHD